jgi:hypothetical protein
VTPVAALQRWASRYARIALAAAFLSAVAGRFAIASRESRAPVSLPR